MEETLYKIQFTKEREMWICSLMFLNNNKGVDMWEEQDTIEKESYPEMMKEAANRSWIDILNNTAANEEPE